MGEKPVFSRLLTLGLALLLAAYTVFSYPLSLVGEIAATTVLLVVVVTAGRWVFTRQHHPKLSSVLSPPCSPLVIFLIVFSATVTAETLSAREIYGLLRAIDSTPAYALVVRLLHYLVVIAVVLLIREGHLKIGLGVALVYTSIFYTPTFATPEAAPPFVPLTALAVVLFAALPLALQNLPDLSRVSSHSARRAARSPLRNVTLSAPLVLFILLALISVLFSFSKQDSLVWLLKLMTLLAFTLFVPLTIYTEADWKRIALLVVIFSVALPVAVSVAKLAMLTWELGLWPTIWYRLGLTELGRPNLIARSLIVGAPLLIAWAMTASYRKQRILWWGLGILTLLIFIMCRSWSGGTGFGLACLFVVVVVTGPGWTSRWKTRRSRLGWYLLHIVVIAVLIGGVLMLLRAAPQARVASFNGRLLKYQATFKAILDRPLGGVGPGHYYLVSGYYPGLDWLVNTQVTLDGPLLSVYRLSEAMTLHTHNLLFEIGLGIGILGLAVFTWFIVELIRYGLRARAQLRGRSRVLVTGCLAGIIASLGWGAIDVMEVSSPFFTFPTWALVGLLLAAPRVFGVGEGQRTEDGDSSPAIRQPSFVNCYLSSIPSQAWRFVQHAIPITLILAVTVVVVVAPLLGNLHYRTAYNAFQERRWETALDELARASRWEPLNAKYQQLRGEALINLGRYAEAVSAYERAAHLKRDFAPYHTQLGWLYWLLGDLEQATTHLEIAVETDPHEAWRDGLHADLGLAYVAQGRVEKAITLFKETIELDPKLALAPYWVPVQGVNGAFDVVLDPVYLSGPSPELAKRVLAHLGKADYTARLFAVDGGVASSPSFNEVLDAIEADYSAARAVKNRAAPRILAAAAEAARLAGLHERAERAYLTFQEVFPQSAYGFRELGSLYREQGRLGEAQVMLERAVRVSPRDTAGWLALTETYLDGGRWEEAEEALETSYRLAPLKAGVYELWAQFHLRRGDSAQAADALHKSLVIQESIPNRLILANLYRQLGRPQQAIEQCIQAADALWRTWPRAVASELWEIGVCLAQTKDERRTTNDESWRSILAARERPHISNVLLGHVFRAQGQLEQALQAYQAAADARPDEGAPHYFQGEIYQALGQSASAEAKYRQAAQLDPLESLPLLALGRLYWSQGRQEAGLGSFRAAVATTPGWGQTHVVLGNALLALGERKAAAQHYQRAQIVDRDTCEGLVYDFTAHLAEAEVTSPGAEYVRGEYFAINGDERRVLFMHPNSRARYVVKVPEDGVLAFDVATAPESWEQPGDGVAFAVYIESDVHTQGAAQSTQKAYSAYIDPKQDDGARRWHSNAIDLSAYAGQTINIIFETDIGPTGDYRFDWAGWGRPRLLGPLGVEQSID